MCVLCWYKFYWVGWKEWKGSSFKFKPGKQDLVVLWAGLTRQVWGSGLILSVGKQHWGKSNKNKTHPPSSNFTVYAFLAALHSIFMICRFLHLLSMIFASPARRQLPCLLYKHAIGYVLQTSSDIKEQIISAFKCTRINYQIWKIIPASGAILLQRQWIGLINVSKLDHLIISPKRTLKSKLDIEGDFICSFLGYLCLEIYWSYSGGQSSPHYTPSPVSLSCVINIFFQYSQPSFLMLFC